MKRIVGSKHVALVDEPILCITSNGVMELSHHMAICADMPAVDQWCSKNCEAAWAIDYSIISFESKTDLIKFKMIMNEFLTLL